MDYKIWAEVVSVDICIQHQCGKLGQNKYMCVLGNITWAQSDVGKSGDLAWKQGGMWENVNEFSKN